MSDTREPTWVALATERLGMPCDQWLIAHAATGRGYRWLHQKLRQSVDEGGAGLTFSYFPVQMRLQHLRPLIEEARALIDEQIEGPRAAVADRVARDVLAAASAASAA